MRQRLINAYQFALVELTDTHANSGLAVPKDIPGNTDWGAIA